MKIRLLYSKGGHRNYLNFEFDEMAISYWPSARRSIRKALKKAGVTQAELYSTYDSIARDIYIVHRPSSIASDR